MTSWTNIFGYSWPAGSMPVLVLLALIMLILARHRKTMWRRTAPFFGIFIVSQFGLLSAGILRWWLGDLAAAAPLRDVSLFVEGVAIIGLVGRVLFGVLLVRFRPPRIAEDVLLIVAYLVWGLARLRLGGVDVMGVVATSAVITGVIAFAMQDTISNVLGGLALQFDRSVKIGQWIRVDDVVGKVRQVRWRSTTVETLDWETVVIPNSFLVKSKFRVIGLDRGNGLRWRRSIEFDADSEFSADRVVSVAQQALASAEIKDILDEPKPICIMTSVGVGLGRYSLHYWIADINSVETVKSDVLRHLTMAMERAAIRLFAPTLANVIVTGTRRFNQDLAVLEHDGRFRALKCMEQFQSLTDAELESLMPHLTRAPFATGGVILRQGAKPRWLYLLTRGDVDLVVEDAGQPRRALMTLTAPSLLGEPGMVSGSPRTVSAIARTDVECFRLDKEGFAGVLRAKPEVTQVLAERIAALAAIRESALSRNSTDYHPQETTSSSSDLFSRVSRFFGLGPD